MLRIAGGASMKNTKMVNKGRVSVLLGLFMAIVITVVSVMPLSISADTQTPPQDEYFEISKTWKNDSDANERVYDVRPSELDVWVVGKTGETEVSREKFVLTANENWKKTISLPATTEAGEEIVYSAFEVVPEKYSSSASETAPITIQSVLVDDFSKRQEVSSYVVNKSGFGSVPIGNVSLNANLSMADAEISKFPDEKFEYLTEGNTYAPDGNVVGSNQPHIIYKDSFKKGSNPVAEGGQFTLTWTDAATNGFTGEKYDLRITISNIVIETLSDMTKGVVILANNKNGELHLQSYVTEFDGTPETKNDNVAKNLVGVSAKVKVEVLKKDGTGADGLVQVSVIDLDMPDYIKCYKSGLNIFTQATDNSVYGVGSDFPYVESVKLESGVASDVYLSGDNSVLTYSSDRARYASSYYVSGNDDPRQSIRLLAKANGYEYTWTGSNCGTIIIADSPSVAPDPSKYSNVITNVTSAYVVKTIYMNDSNVYDEDDPNLTRLFAMEFVAPGSDVSVTDEQKKPELENYVLDQEKDADWSGKTTEENGPDSPKLLKIYFKKVYRVIYHDSVDDKVWNKDDQTYLELSYNTDTPGYDTDLKTEGIQTGDPVRSGYDFVGWHDQDEPDKILTNDEVLALKVTKNADYWAHWIPRTDTKYRVEYYYEVNGRYPSTPDGSVTRQGTTDSTVTIIETDKDPQKPDYFLNADMTLDWKGVVAGDGSLVLKVYFKQKPQPTTSVTKTYTIPVTGVE